jgi:hypothetical protein
VFVLILSNKLDLNQETHFTIFSYIEQLESSRIGSICVVLHRPINPRQVAVAFAANSANVNEPSKSDQNTNFKLAILVTLLRYSSTTSIFNVLLQHSEAVTTKNTTLSLTTQHDARVFIIRPIVVLHGAGSPRRAP